MRRALFAALLCLALAHPGPGRAQPVPQPFPLVAEVLAPPWIFPGADGQRHMLYELQLLNVMPGPVHLRRITISDTTSGATLGTLDEAEIARRFEIGAQRDKGGTVLGAGQFGIGFLHLALPADGPTPAGVVHDVELYAEPARQVLRLAIGQSPVIVTPPPVLGPPLRGGRYIVGDGCCDSTRHIRALLPLNGRFRLAQRFAVDWERLDDDDRIFVGERTDPRSYRIHGAPVLAVADGSVVAALDGLPEQVPGTYPADLPIEQADGNFVVLDIGGGAFVLYAHLRPGSVAVQAGARVKRGDVLGAVGNTGNSVAPHLHLHVMDGPSALMSNGIPSVFDAFAVTAFNPAGTADFDRAEGTGSRMTLTPITPPRQVRGAMPMDLTIVDWGP
ncbi:M23 family metallopeptidase [Humitalea sp. 24SJ18S-53]|uniref:M23 family metallopeptidase n=1 Tax=Humitalea sp. 24SJ18S-53 TaxID=3422307 RepID=UPI003D67F7D5